MNKHTYTTPCSQETLRAMYVDRNMSQIEIAEALGLTRKGVCTAMRRWGIPCRKAAKRSQIGSRNHAWKGPRASYQAFHLRVATMRGKPTKCDVCGTTDPEKSYDWANLTGKYDDVSDYKRMCRSCHWKFDGKAKNFRGAKGGRRPHA